MMQSFYVHVGTLLAVAVGVVRVLVDRQSVGALHVRVGSRQVRQNRGRSTEPFALPTPQHCPEHVSPTAGANVHLLRDTCTYDANSDLLFANFAGFIP